MSAECPKCQSTDIRRKRRSSAIARLGSAVGCWPYFCASCCRTFYLRQRKVEQAASAYTETHSFTPEPEQGPRAAYRTDSVKPYAKIMLQAEDQNQLDSILLALSRVVSEHQTRAAGQGCAAH